MQFEVDRLGDAITINLWGQEGSLIDHRIRRLIDQVGATILLLLLSPLMLGIALLISINSPGPVLC